MFAGAQPRRNNVVAHFLSVIDWTQVQRPLAAFFEMIFASKKRSLARQEVRKSIVGGTPMCRTRSFVWASLAWFPRLTAHSQDYTSAET
jgi:hypothetical protein